MIRKPSSCISPTSPKTIFLSNISLYNLSLSGKFLKFIYVTGKTNSLTSKILKVKRSLFYCIVILFSLLKPVYFNLPGYYTNLLGLLTRHQLCCCSRLPQVLDKEGHGSCRLVRRVKNLDLFQMYKLHQPCFCMICM